MCGPNLAFTTLLTATSVLKCLRAASPGRGLTTVYLKIFRMCCHRLFKLRWSSWIIMDVYSTDLETEIRQEAHPD